jgi:hypothetical protein
MPVEEPAVGNRISTLQSEIRDLATVVDATKARAAMAAGGAVFLLLVTALGVHDLATGAAGIWLAVGFDESTVRTMTIAAGVMGLFLLIAAILRGKAAQREIERQLTDLEQQLAELLAKADSSEAN